MRHDVDLMLLMSRTGHMLPGGRAGPRHWEHLASMPRTGPRFACWRGRRIGERLRASRVVRVAASAVRRPWPARSETPARSEAPTQTRRLTASSLERMPALDRYADPAQYLELEFAVGFTHEEGLRP